MIEPTSDSKKILSEIKEMLFGEPDEKSQKQLIIWGDYQDLRNAREVVSSFATQHPLESWHPAGTSDFVLGLAYELRKAYELRREKSMRLGASDESQLTYYGTKLSYPIFVIQVGLLRRAAAFRPTTRIEQAVLFSLEAVLESALTRIDPDISDRVMSWIEIYQGISGTISIANIENEVEQQWEKSRQQHIIKALPKLLNDLHMTKPMRQILADVEARAMRRKTKIDE